MPGIEMRLQPKLIDVTLPRDPAGVVVVLHGGASRREQMMVSPTQLSVLRMIPIAKRIARAGDGRLAVVRLLNSRRGWDAHQTPVHDVRWALGQLAERVGDELPVCLVGHSLGGRAALLAAGERQVRRAVALAPWVHPSDVAPGLAGRELLLVHGSRDRIASPQRSAALARNLARSARVGYVTVDGGRHAMLRHHGVFDRLAADFATATLLGARADGALARVRDGERFVVV
jgi:dienelactone hydrolase